MRGTYNIQSDNPGWFPKGKPAWNKLEADSSYGHWTVLREAETRGTDRVFLCRCECGTEKEVYFRYLRDGKSVSCGCMKNGLIAKSRTTHGHTTGKPSLTYNSWAAMIQRCTNPKHKFASHYSEYGITVCDKWRNSFEAFLDDMGERPNKDLSIDRIDPYGNYEPGNCRWATKSQQAKNIRKVM